MDKDRIHNMIAETQPNICQVVVCRNNEEIFSDEWNGYSKDDCTHIMSATKSIMSLLLGIAIDQGNIHSLDEKVLAYFPEYQVKRGEKTIQDVTIRHLITMRAPYKCKGDPWSKVCSSENWTYTSLDFLGGRKGLTDEFNYQTVCLHILSGILFKATGMNTVDYANKYLFEPLGVARHENYYAMSAEEHKHFTIDKEPKGNVWFADPQGLGTPGYGLCMSATDMAKIGLLCLNEGNLNGNQIIPASWIHEMTQPRTVESDWFRGMMYGYMWWIIHPERNIYAAIGNSGNVIYVNPEEKTVVAISSYFKPTVFDRIDFIEQKLLPLISCSSSEP